MSGYYGVFGTGGCGRGIMPLVRRQFPEIAPDRLVFVDDAHAGQACNGHDTISLDSFAVRSEGGGRIVLAVADPGTRSRIAVRCEAAGIRFFQVRAANVIEMDVVVIGDGALLSPFVTLTSNIRIGRHFHANIYSYVEHDCVIGDFVTFAPGVHCNGNVHIGDGAYIGAGAIIRQGRPGAPLTIGAGSVVGMGAVVTRDVPSGATVIGNPARPLPR